MPTMKAESQAVPRTSGDLLNTERSRGRLSSAGSGASALAGSVPACARQIQAKIEINRSSGANAAATCWRKPTGLSTARRPKAPEERSIPMPNTTTNRVLRSNSHSPSSNKKPTKHTRARLNHCSCPWLTGRRTSSRRKGYRHRGSRRLRHTMHGDQPLSHDGVRPPREASVPICGQGGWRRRGGLLQSA